MLPQHLRQHLRVPTEKLDDLEILRKAFGLPHETFIMGITISPWMVTKVQEEARQQLRRLYPQASEKESRIQDEIDRVLEGKMSLTFLKAKIK